MKDKFNDPRKYPGSIVGPGDSHAKDEFIVDTTNALVLEDEEVVKLETPNGKTIIGLLLGGRIVRTKDKAKFLVLMNEDGMAALITELIAITGRMSGNSVEQFLNDLVDRIKKLKEDGDLS